MLEPLLTVKLHVSPLLKRLDDFGRDGDDVARQAVDSVFAERQAEDQEGVHVFVICQSIHFCLLPSAKRITRVVSFGST